MSAGSDVGSGGDLGIVAGRAEAAVLAEGRPLDDLTVPPPADPRKVAKAARAWVRKPTGPVPFDGVPDPTTAAWFATQVVASRPVDADGQVIPWERFVDPEVQAAWPGRAAWVDPKERLRAADEAAHTPPTVLPGRVRGHDWGLLPAPLDTGARIALLGADSVLDVEAALAGDLPPRAVLGLRAYGLPGVTPAVRERLLTLVADPAAEPVARLTASALVATPEDHHALVLDLGPEPYVWANPTTKGDQVLLRDPHLLLAVAAALPDADARRTLWSAVDDRVRQGRVRPSELAVSFPHPDLALVVFGEPVVRGLVARKWVANAVVAQARALLQRLSGPAAVPWVLQLALSSSKVTGVVQEWLVEHRAVVGAFDGSLVAARTEVLVAAVPALVEAGQTTFAHPAAAAAAALVVGRPEAPTFGATGLPGWWTTAVEAERAAPPGARLPRTLPDWVLATPLTVGGEALAGAEARALLAAAAATVEDGARRPLVAAAVARMDPDERDLAGVSLLRGWIAAGERSQDKPFARAGAVLGADGWVAETMDRVREWNEGRYNRAKLGLELVTLNASPAAAAALAGARTWKKGGMDWIAGVQLGVLSDLLGLSEAELSLRLVPTGDLDARGTRTFATGGRTFRAAVRPDATVVVHLLGPDGRPSGKPRTGIPPATAADDPAQVAAAKKALTALRGTVAEVARTQAAQLEAALVDESAWTAADHATYVAAHPLLNVLLRGLVWRVAASDGGATLVRLEEGGEYVTADDEPFEPPAGATVTLPHPVRLSAVERTAWRAHLADHDLVPPLPQLDRLPEGYDGRSAPVLPVGPLHPGTLRGVLTGHGWGTGTRVDDVATSYDRAYLAAEVVAELRVTGVLAYNLALSPEQTVTELVVRRFDGSSVSWADLPPVVAAEVGRAVAALAAKAG